MEGGSEPPYEKLLSRIEGVETKRLVVWVEEQARHRRITQSLTDARTMGTETANEALNRMTDYFRRRRRIDANQASKSLLIERPSETAKPTAETRHLLEQAMRFHRDRNAK